MVHPTKQEVLDCIRQNAPIKTKKAFTDIFKYIHQFTYNDSTTENDVNEIMINFLTNTARDFYITSKQVSSLRRYGYYHRKEFLTLPWLKYNVIKGYIPDENDIANHTEYFDFDTIVELVKRHKDINPKIYFQNYNVLDKLFRNNDELFKIDTKDPKELDKLKTQIDFIDRFFADTGINPCMLLNTTDYKIHIPYHIDKKNYNLETVYTNYLLYRKFKKLTVDLYELINLSIMLFPKINDDYILYNKYNKQQLSEQIIRMKDSHMKSELLKLLSRNIINSKYYYDSATNNYVLEKPIADSDDSDTDENELEQDIAHLTDEQRLEMGFPVKPKPTIVNTSDGPKIFDIIYNDKYDEDLLMIIGGMFNSESYHSHSEIQIKLFNHLINKGCPLTEKAFKLYCKYCNCVIIEIFLENKFKPTDDIFLEVNFDTASRITNLYKLLNKYNYYISAEILPKIWNKLRSQHLTPKIIQEFSIYINNDEEFNKILPELETEYNKHTQLKDMLNNSSYFELLEYIKTNKLTLEMIMLCKTQEKRLDLLDLYKLQNGELQKEIQPKKKIIRKIIKTKSNINSSV